MLTRMMGTDRQTDGQTQVTTITLRPKRPRVKNPCHDIIMSHYDLNGAVSIWFLSLDLKRKWNFRRCYVHSKLDQCPSPTITMGYTPYLVITDHAITRPYCIHAKCTTNMIRTSVRSCTDHVHWIRNKLVPVVDTRPIPLTTFPL